MKRVAISECSPAQRRKIRERSCVNCGGLNCDPAHLTPRTAGGCQDADCVIGLCRECHTNFDLGLLDLEPVLALRQFSAERSHMAAHMSLRQCIRRLTGERL